MEKQTLVLLFKKETKWTVVYETDLPTAGIRSVYVQKAALPKPFPTAVKVTLEGVEAAP
jgi:hypothetical protein